MFKQKKDVSVPLPKASGRCFHIGHPWAVAGGHLLLSDKLTKKVMPPCCVMKGPSRLFCQPFATKSTVSIEETPTGSVYGLAKSYMLTIA